MSSKFPIRYAILPFALAGALTGSIVDAASADTDRLNEAWKDGIGDQEAILTDKQFAVLNNLAYQAAVPKICDSFILDVPKFAQAIDDVVQFPTTQLSVDDMKQWQTAVLIRFGVSYGLFLAEGNNKPDDFCAEAKTLNDDSSVPNYLKSEVGMGIS